MKRIIVNVALLLTIAACGSQLVEFPANEKDQTNVSTSGSGGAGGMVNSNGVGGTNSSSSISITGSGGSEVGSVSASGEVSSSNVSGTGGNNPCDNVECPEGKVCLNGLCVCDGDPEPKKQCGFSKVLMCHYPPGNLENAHEICVGVAAVPAHLKHNDTLGLCP